MWSTPNSFNILCFLCKGMGVGLLRSAPEWWAGACQGLHLPMSENILGTVVPEGMHQRGGWCFPVCQRVIRVFLWEPRAESGRLRRGGRGRRKREKWWMKGPCWNASIPVRRRALSNQGQAYKSGHGSLQRESFNILIKLINTSCSSEQAGPGLRKLRAAQRGGDGIGRRDSLALHRAW